MRFSLRDERTLATRRPSWPFWGYGDNERPVWLDMGTLRYERGEGFTNGFCLGMALATLAVVVMVVIAAILHA